MSISLSKGGNISLSKESPGIKQIRIGLGWDARVTTGHDFDLFGEATAVPLVTFLQPSQPSGNAD